MGKPAGSYSPTGTHSDRAATPRCACYLVFSVHWSGLTWALCRCSPMWWWVPSLGVVSCHEWAESLVHYQFGPFPRFQLILLLTCALQVPLKKKNLRPSGTGAGTPGMLTVWLEEEDDPEPLDQHVTVEHKLTEAEEQNSRMVANGFLNQNEFETGGNCIAACPYFVVAVAATHRMNRCDDELSL